MKHNDDSEKIIVTELENSKIAGVHFTTAFNRETSADWEYADKNISNICAYSLADELYLKN